MITAMNKNVVQLHAPTTSSNVKMESVSLKLTFVMEKMIAVITRMNLMNMRVFHHHLDVPLVNGNVLESLKDVLISLPYVTTLQTVQMDLMKEKVVI